MAGLAAPLRIREVVCERAGVGLVETKPFERLQCLAFVHVHEILTDSNSHRGRSTV